LQKIWSEVERRLRLIDAIADASGEKKYFTEFADAHAPCHMVTLGVGQFVFTN
jgi:hypothetical protein